MSFDKTLPCGWSFALLKQVIKKLVDGSHNPPPKQEHGFPMLSARNIENGQINFNNYRFIEQKAFEIEDKRTQVRPGDVLLTIVGAIGRTATVPDNIDLFTLQRSVAVLSPVGMIPDFLMYQLQSPQVQKELLKEAKGTAQKGIYLKTLGSIPVLLPPLNEQRRIVTKIEALSARSQRVKEALEDIPQLLNQFRQSVLAAAFRGDLTANWREQNSNVEPAEVLLERIRAERRQCWEEAELEKMKASGKVPKDDKWKDKYKEPESVDDSQLPELPDGWCWVTADECTSLITDGEHATPERSDEGVYLLSARNVLNGKLSFEKVDFVPEYVYQKLEKRLKLEVGDVLLSCSGTVGRSCVAPPDLRCAFVRSVAILKPLFEMGEYLSLAIRSPYLQAQIEKKKTQTAQSNIFQGRIKTLAIPVAPFDEQKVIVRAIAQSFKMIENVEQVVEDAKNRGTKLDQSILAKAFRGELVPQDPNDEPASVLLERIRAERAKLQTKTAKKSTTKTRARRTKKTQSQPEESVQLELGLE